MESTESPVAGLRVPLGQGEWLVWRDFAVRSSGFPLSRLTSTADEMCGALADKYAEDPAAEAEFRAYWPTALERSCRRMLENVESGGVRQALLWQSPGALDRVVTWLHDSVGKGSYLRNRRQKRDELTLVKYLQRYHTKNETIGFFGPVAWGTFAGPGEECRAVPGPRLFKDRSVIFEVWALAALGDTFAGDIEIRRHLPPALSPQVALHGRAVLRSDAPMLVLDRTQALVCALCDGLRTPREIADELTRAGGTTRVGDGAVVAPDAGDPVDAVLEHLDALVGKGVVNWGFDIPPSPDAAAALRDQLSGLPSSYGRDRALATLGELDLSRRDLPWSDVPAAQLEAALNGLDAQFTEATGAAAYRDSGHAAKGRRVVIEDCARDVDVTIGTGFLDGTAAAMRPLLDSARWLMHRLGDAYTTVLDDTFTKLGGGQGQDVPLSQLTALAIPEIQTGAADAPVIAEFQDRWREVLEYNPLRARQDYRTEEIRDAVTKVFGTPQGAVLPWHSAAYHSPDLMIAEDAGAGGTFAVMGEMHLSQVSHNSRNFSRFHPDPERLVAAGDEHEHPTPWHVPLYPRSVDNLTSHWYPTPELQSRRHTYLSFGPRCGARPAPRDLTVRIDALAVRRSPQGLITVRTDGGGPHGHGTPLLETVAEMLVQRATDHFRLMAPLEHTPRITIGRLVVARETWRPLAAGVPVGKGTDEAAAFARLRQWARRLGMPRHMFWRVPWESKPIYLDFANPQLVGLFAMTLRRAKAGDGHRVTLTEMLPRPDQLWLRDAGGSTYTSEIRLVAVDNSRNF
ncbi:lantibiotic dehydratase [Streptomyces sp. NPDC058665]|uniref:lantibiotic dehydratase n=1 Tax=Streptomyces sp. NPDC058665 TaxID=3346586 RepID=UPI00365538C1